MLNKNAVLDSLLKYNYFPYQKKDYEEMPPVFNTQSLEEDIAREIMKAPKSGFRNNSGFDVLNYKSTRFNNVPRVLSIPHPKPYIDLCFSISNHWDKIEHICSNNQSLICPQKHRDKRIIILNYEQSPQKRNRFLKCSFGKKFIVFADISNCFPSLYSHSIPWALVGFERAKNDRHQNRWFNKLDKNVRMLNRNETSGVSIGPATSNIICELVLQNVDKPLKDKGFTFYRFIDDYVAYCETYEKAEEFVRILSLELMKYKLNLNIKKTEINYLPQPSTDAWIGKLREIIPNNKKINSSEVSKILDTAIRIQKSNSDGSILKYAAKSIASKLDEGSARTFVNYIIKLCFYYPILIPILIKVMIKLEKKVCVEYTSQLQHILKESIRNFRSDAMCWTLYLYKICGFDLSGELAKNIIETKDPLSLIMLSQFDKHIKPVVDFANKLDNSYNYEIDNYWLLLYELYFSKLISKPYNDNNDNKYFEILKSNKISFVEF